MVRHTFYFLLLFIVSHTFIAAQQFNLLWEYKTKDNYFLYLGDIDRDGKGEFYISDSYSQVGDTNLIFDYLLSSIKYDLNITDFVLNIASYDTPLYLVDFTNDGHVDPFFRTSNSFGIYDLVNQTVLFEIYEKEEPLYTDIYLQEIADVNGDNRVDLLINESKSGPFPTYDIYYLYSTDVPITSVSQGEGQLIQTPTLRQNYPNPFNPSTIIRYSIPEPGTAVIRIFNVTGELIRTITKEHSSKGSYSVSWNGKNDHGERVSSNVYFYQLNINNYQETKKMILLK